jgi:hypothetical protein
MGELQASFKPNKDECLAFGAKAILRDGDQVTSSGCAVLAKTYAVAKTNAVIARPCSWAEAISTPAMGLLHPFGILPRGAGGGLRSSRKNKYRRNDGFGAGRFLHGRGECHFHGIDDTRSATIRIRSVGW